tara:strand:+ start:11161 stop:12279 length:1119 start_codon:yes stop_codon:yes gene_type:complete
MARRSIGKPRFYADILQYIKALGYYKGSDFQLGDNAYNNTNHFELFNMNPNQPKEFTEHITGSIIRIEANYRFQESKDLNNLLTSIPQSDVSGLYAGILGHNFATTNIATYFGLTKWTDDTTAGQTSYCTYESPDSNIANILNGANEGYVTSHFDHEYDGYSLLNIEDFRGANWETSESNIDRLKFAAITDQLPDGAIPKIGAVTFGRWFEPEFSFDLKGTISNTYEGVSTQRTVGGSSLTNINHLGQPNWGDLPAWTFKKQEDRDYNLGGEKGRRQWNVGFSFLTDEKLFNKAGNPDKFFTYDEDTEQYTFDDSLSSFLKLTLNGKLPFIFCPDNDADEKEFAICRVTNQPTFSQVANNLFSTSLTITETW